MLFTELANYLERLSSTTSRLKASEILAEALEEAEGKDLEFAAQLLTGALYPPYKNRPFAVPTESIDAAAAEVLGVSVQEFAKERARAGDAGSAFEKLGSEKHLHEGKLKVSEMAEKLERLAEISGTGATKKKQNFLTNILKCVGAIEGKYILRLVAGKMRLGFSEATLIDAIAEAFCSGKKNRRYVERAYNVLADIGKIATVAREEGLEGIKKVRIHFGIPIRPAAAERVKDAAGAVKRVGLPCSVQPKLDGFRLQVHVYLKEGKKRVKFFSRNMQDMGHAFPEIESFFEKHPSHGYVVEGECIGYNADEDLYLPFQTTVKRRRKYNVEKMMEEVPLHLFMFDVLAYGGDAVIEKPYEERRKLLVKLMGDAKRERDAASVIPELIAKTQEEVESYFVASVEKGAEGVVAKKLHAEYQAGKRGFNWVKLKRVPRGELGDSIDCVILGYYRGSGKRAKLGIGALLLGIRNARSDKIETVAKVGSGLSDEQWKEMKERLDKLSLKEFPPFVRVDKRLEPDVIVEPKIVVSVAAEEVTRSELHTAGRLPEQRGYALRFPRIIEIRTDKSVDEITTLKELVRIAGLKTAL